MASDLSPRQLAPPASTVALLGTFGLVALHLLLADTSPVISLAEAGGAVAISPDQLLALRALFACVHLCNIVFTATVPVTLNVVYKADLGSLLKPESFRLTGLPRLYTFFTIWSYAAQGLYFALAAGASAALAHGVGVGLYGARVLYAMHLLFEITAGASILVTVVVTFVIWSAPRAHAASPVPAPPRRPPSPPLGATPSRACAHTPHRRPRMRPRHTPRAPGPSSRATR
jgi:hypothetical protein